MQSSYREIPPVPKSPEVPAFANISSIFIDARGSRGGRGDVASAYLTAQDLISRLKFSGTITILVNQTANRILGDLVGTQDPEELRRKFSGRIEFRTLEEIPAGTKAVDLYMFLASPSGRERFSGGYAFRYTGQDPTYPAGRIPIDSRTVRVVQTVLGSTENERSVLPKGTITIGAHRFTMEPAGLGPHESGIYYDTVALALRDKNPEQVRRMTLAAIARMSDVEKRSLLENLVNGRTFAGSEVALVYGVTHTYVKDQFETYLQGLARAADQDHRSFTLVTPSGFALTDVSIELRDKIVLVETPEQVPKRAQPGKIYIVKTGGIPHEVFTSLIAYSQIPPIVAGDGAFSAAIAIGRPFVMTRIQWNAVNVDNFTLLLKRHMDPRFHDLLEEIRVGQLSNALLLDKEGTAFAKMLDETKPLTDTVLRHIEVARQSVAAISADSSKVASIADPALRIAHNLRLAGDGDVEAARSILTEYMKLEGMERGDFGELIKVGMLDEQILRSPTMMDFALAQVALPPTENAHRYFALQMLGNVEDEPRAVLALAEVLRKNELERFHIIALDGLARFPTSERLGLIRELGLASQDRSLAAASANALLAQDPTLLKDYAALKKMLPPDRLMDLLTMNTGATFAPTMLQLTDEFMRVLAEAYVDPKASNAYKETLLKLHNNWKKLSADIANRFTTIYLDVKKRHSCDGLIQNLSEANLAPAS
ncbi:MAG TPA: hypothetical protein VM901_05845 [Bdellovibrionota bacterium]|jgi:hypothetical protein|nr:hypothetical protein [Bdellovibrionota bacterium]